MESSLEILIYPGQKIQGFIRYNNWKLMLSEWLYVLPVSVWILGKCYYSLRSNGPMYE